jgi:hypothetical protein
MSAEQAPKRRGSSIIERSQYAPNRSQGDDRRRQLDSLGHDPEATERAKQEMAQIARQQRGLAHAPVQLDDLEVQQRKSFRMVVAPAPSTDTPTSPPDDAMAAPDPQMPAANNHPRQPPAVATTKKVQASASASAINDQSHQPPAVATTKKVRASASAESPSVVTTKKVQASAPAQAERIRFERIEHSSVRPATPVYPVAYQRDDRYAPQEVYHYWEAPIALARHYPLLLLIMVALVCVPVIGMFMQSPKTFISAYNGAGDVVNSLLNRATHTQNLAANVPAGEHSVLGAPSIDAAAIDAILAKYGSPAAGTGDIWVKFGEQYGIDPAYAVAFFIHESSAGTNPGWAGIKPDGSTTHNVGNIICAGYATCYNRFRDYASWDEGIADWYKLISNEYVSGRGAASVEQIIPIYAPSFENDVNGYIQTVVMLVDGWRRQGVVR